MRRANAAIAALLAVGVAAGLMGLPAKSREAIQDRNQRNGAEFKGQVVYVDDGDSVVVLTEGKVQLKVRLASIDAPEVSHTSHEAGRIGQPYADGAKRYLAHLVKGKTVDLKCPETDRYGRSVCDLFVSGQSVDREMVRQGWAWANEAARGRYMRDPQIPVLEAEARHERRGLWAAEHPVAPWEWRKTCWEQHVCR